MHIKKGTQYMKVLRINNGKGQFSIKEGDYKPIDEISKDDLLEILKLIIKAEDIEFDEITDKNKVDNVAQNIVYSRLLSKIKELKERKRSIIDEVNSEFKDAIEKYIGEN